MGNVEAKRDGITYCVYTDESCLPDKETIKIMKSAGYKFYQNGKVYKFEDNK